MAESARMIRERRVSSQPAIPLPQLIRILARELADTKDLAESLQHALGLDQKVGANDEAFIQEAQGLDLLTQKLVGLHSFTEALAGLVPANCRVDPRSAARGVTLTSVAERLSCVEPTTAAASAEVEFF